VRRTREPNTPTPVNPGRLSLSGEGLAWLGAALLLGAGGWLKSINLVLILAYMMATLLCLNGLLARLQVRRVEVAHSPAPPVHAGEEATVRVKVTNTGRRPATVSIADRVGETESNWLIYRLVAGASAPCAARLVFPTRGRFPSGIRVSSGFPLGLVQYERVVTSGADFVVLPALGVAEANGMRQWILRQAGGEGRVRRVLRRLTTDQADVRGLRPYRPGDPIREIHWRSSARRGELMVREYDAAPSPDLVLVVEPWLPAHPTDTHLANLEAALSLAATIAQTWGREYGTRVTVAVAGDSTSVRTAAASDSGVRDALTPLAGVEGATGFDAFAPAVFDRSLLRAGRVVVSSRPRTPYAAALTRSTGRPFIAMSPADRLPWYEPPPSEVMRKGAVVCEDVEVVQRSHS